MTYMALQSELADCRHAYTDMKERALTAEAALTQCQQELDACNALLEIERWQAGWKARAEQAEAALAERDKPCVWRLRIDGEIGPACRLGRAIAIGSWKFCPYCGHPIEVES